MCNANLSLIDILGILIDNAVEAQESSIEIKQLKISVYGKRGSIYI